MLDPGNERLHTYSALLERSTDCIYVNTAVGIGRGYHDQQTISTCTTVEVNQIVNLTQTVGRNRKTKNNTHRNCVSHITSNRQTINIFNPKRTPMDQNIRSTQSERSCSKNK